MSLPLVIQQNDGAITSVNTPPGSHRPLHDFTALPSCLASVLTPRRCPPVSSPKGNGVRHLSVLEATGFRKLTVDAFAGAINALRPDVVVAMADIGTQTSNAKRLIVAADRTWDWIDELLRCLSTPSAVFAPVPAVPYHLQWQYISHLEEPSLLARLSGLAFYHLDIVPELASNSTLHHLPRLLLDPILSPHAVLRAVSFGIDLCCAPFVNSASDSGVALTFSFPAPNLELDDPALRIPLGLDLSSPEHKTSLAPLLPGCECYTCSAHHRAYLHHLLDSKEMLAWTLLQLHNLHIAAAFFSAVRTLLHDPNPEAFDRERRRFHDVYSPDLPSGSSTRPRIRGYHFKSEANAPKANPPAWVKPDATDEVGHVEGLEQRPTNN